MRIYEQSANSDMYTHTLRNNDAKLISAQTNELFFFFFNVWWAHLNLLLAVLRV